MALTGIEVAGPYIQRAACFACAALALLIVYVLSDVWRIERRQGRAISAVAIGVLAAACLGIGTLFAHCALTGVMPQPPVTGGCQ